MPNVGLLGVRIAHVSAFVCGIGLAITTLLIMARRADVDPFQMTGPEVVQKLSTGATILLFGSTAGALFLGMVLGSQVGPALFGYGRWDRIDELDTLQLDQIRGSGLDVNCPACMTSNALVVPHSPSPIPLPNVAVLCKGCRSAIRACVSGNLLALSTFAKKALVLQAHARRRGVS